MLLPQAERAEVDIRKLTDYCLNPEHWEGKHKARLFAAALGITLDDAPHLRAMLLEMVLKNDAQLGLRGRIRATLYGGLLIRMAWEASHDSDWLDH
jgi:hypothetical protein